MQNFSGLRARGASDQSMAAEKLAQSALNTILFSLRFILWSNLALKLFKLVKSSNFYDPSKYVKMLPFWFATKFDEACFEGEAEKVVRKIARSGAL